MLCCDCEKSTVNVKTRPPTCLKCQKFLIFPEIFSKIWPILHVSMVIFACGTIYMTSSTLCSLNMENLKMPLSHQHWSFIHKQALNTFGYLDVCSLLWYSTTLFFSNPPWIPSCRNRSESSKHTVARGLL